MLHASRFGARAGALARPTSASSRSTRLAPAAALLALLGACQDPAAPPGAAPSPAPRFGAAPAAAASRAGEVIPDEYIVTFRDSVADAPGLAKQLVAQHGGALRFQYGTALKGFAAHMSAQAAEALARNPRVARVEPDRQVLENGVQINAPWHLDRLDQRALPLDRSFASPRSGAGVNIYVLDSGIRTTHREFGGRALGAYSAISDGRGTDDCTGHGTMVASAAAGSTFGVAKQATLWAVRVLDCSGGGATSGIIAGVDWVTRNARKPAVANMSLGGAVSSALNSAVANSIAAGVTYVVSAGNGATDACTQSPANVGAALTVASTTDTDTQASWSNYGPCVDVYAPGTNVMAAWFSSDTTTTRSSGTSLSAPLVTGAAALYLERRPGALPNEVAQGIAIAATLNAVKSAGTGSPNVLLGTAGLDTVAVVPTADTIGTTTSPGTAPTPPAAPATVDTPPIASLTVSCAKGNCTFDGSGSRDDTKVVSYTWDFGDLSASTVSSGSTVKYAYRTAGTWTVTLTVRDAAGQAGVARAVVTVKRI